MASCFDGREGPAKGVPRVRRGRCSRRGVELCEPFRRVSDTRGSGASAAAYPPANDSRLAAVLEASLVGLKPRPKSKPSRRCLDSVSARARVRWPLPSILSMRSRGRRASLSVPICRDIQPGGLRTPSDSILYCHGRFLGPIVYNGMRRPDTVTFSRRGYDMSAEQAPPFLVDAVRASASKMQGMKAALDARPKELDALRAQLDSERQDLEKRAGRLEAERQAIDGERNEVRAARASVDQDLATIRAERENFSAEQARFQDAANGLVAREKALREAESNVEHLDHEMIGRKRRDEAKLMGSSRR